MFKSRKIEDPFFVFFAFFAFFVFLRILTKEIALARESDRESGRDREREGSSEVVVRRRWGEVVVAIDRSLRVRCRALVRIGGALPPLAPGCRTEP